MIVITPLGDTPSEFFKNYNDLCDYIMKIENSKLIAENPDFQKMNWSFTIFPPRQVVAFFIHLQDKNADIKEAYEEDASLIEICTGDYSRPIYIALTPNIDLDYLKKKWCVDYCTWHHLVVREL